MDKKTYQRTLKKQKRNGKTSLFCVICGEDDPSVLEMHHPFGRSNSDHASPLCKNHHSKVTKEINKLSPEARSKNASPEQKRAYHLVSIGAELKLFGDKLIDIGHEMAEDD